VDIRTASEADLARSVSRGLAPSDAEVELCRRFAPRIRAFGLRHCRENADDLVQAVLLVVLEKLRASEVTDPEHLASFVLGTARRVAADWRSGHRRHERLLEPVSAFLGEHSTVLQPTSIVDWGRLEQCLGRLPARQLAVVLLTYYSELSSPEISSELGVAEGNVRVLRHRALSALHACVAGGAA
jgi:RNA polymerase sigma-70 factor (ECF subfamily)